MFRGKRSGIIANFARASGQEWNHISAKSVARRDFQTHYVNQLLIFLFPRLTKGSISVLYTFEGLEYLEEELSAKRGCILLHAHFGPVHLPVLHLCLEGYDVK